GTLSPAVKDHSSYCLAQAARRPSRIARPRAPLGSGAPAGAVRRRRLGLPRRREAGAPGGAAVKLTGSGPAARGPLHVGPLFPGPARNPSVIAHLRVPGQVAGEQQGPEVVKPDGGAAGQIAPAVSYLEGHTGHVGYLALPAQVSDERNAPDPGRGKRRIVQI